MADLWKLQHSLKYDVYRLNIHTGREIFDWRGINRNTRIVQQHEGLQPMFGVRSMRKVEKLLPTTPFQDYPSIFGWWAQSFLATHVQLAEVDTVHEIDLFHARLSHPVHGTASLPPRAGNITRLVDAFRMLNDGNPRISAVGVS